MATRTGDDTPETLRGTPLGDDISGNGGDDQLFGKKGKDDMDGGSGNDSLFGGKGGDTMLGGLGNDFLDGGKGKDFLDGGDGEDKLYGGKGLDDLKGGEDNDFLYGGDGNDILNGGNGNQNDLYGGLGSDHFVFERDNVGAKTFLRDYELGVDKIYISKLLYATVDEIFEGGAHAKSSGGDSNIDLHRDGNYDQEIIIEGVSDYNDLKGDIILF